MGADRAYRTIYNRLKASDENFDALSAINSIVDEATDMNAKAIADEMVSSDKKKLRNIVERAVINAVNKGQ